ncbi:Receptor-interacting serine threonine- kinase 4 [Brachionus plicatilis]|uniref:Receptor-interacting serine threonine-kinase 4 n=1 Tax=Brachionus plicatilis TaxID=10195 RepID=A0A3M7PAM3_BRAPC|nr:Receptor-interacting serine threonine- kinase 4 [Brachionus plicatilis]
MNFKIQNESISSLSHRYTTTYAIKKGYFNLVRCLLCLGADPNYVEEKENLNRTSLIYTTFIKDNRWAENVAYTLLENGADLSKSDSKGLNPIHYCCTFGRHELLEVFLKSVDFDLSCSLDLNGNSCMHYAIRSGSIRCANLLTKKFVSSNFSKKMNLKNRFGLRPIDIQNQENDLEECKKPLMDHINLENKNKIGELKAKLEIEASLKEKLKKKKTKKPKKVIDKEQSATNEKENKILETFFNTQLDESEFLAKTQDNFYKPAPKLISNSNFNHFTGKLKTKQKNELKIPKIVINAVESDKDDGQEAGTCEALQKPSLFHSDYPTFDLKLESVEQMDTNESIELTLKSFLLTFKDFLSNLIEYNDLFFAKEHMLKDGLHYKLSRVERPKSLENRVKEKKKTSNWKESLPNVFSVYETELTSSFRSSIRPPVIKKVKSNQKYYEDLKTKAKQIALTRKKKSKIIIVRNSLFNKLSSGSQFSLSPESYTESSVFEDELSILPSNGRASTLSVLRKRKESFDEDDEQDVDTDSLFGSLKDSGSEKDPIESLDSDDNEDESENFNTESLTVKENNEIISNDDETNDELEESFEEIRQKIAELELKTVKEKAVFYKEMALAPVESSEEAKKKH